MGLELKGKSEPEKQSFDLMLSGSVVGEVFKHSGEVLRRSPYHVVFRVPDHFASGVGQELIQGHGADVESAIEEALDSAVKRAENLLLRVEELREILTAAGNGELDG